MDVAPSQPSSLPTIAPRSPTPSTGPDICIGCLRPSAVVIREKRKGTHPPEGHVVGLTPEQCRKEFSSTLSWSIMQWQCTECSMLWFSYHFYHDVYDGRWHGKNESPMHLLRKAQETGTLQGWPQSHSQSSSPEGPQRPKRPRIDTSQIYTRVSSHSTPPQSTTSVSVPMSLATSSPFLSAQVAHTSFGGLGQSYNASEYGRVYEQSQSPAVMSAERSGLMISHAGGRVPSRRSRTRARNFTSRHERHAGYLPNVSRVFHDQMFTRQVPADIARRDVFDPRSPSVAGQGQAPLSAQPISPPRSATESRPISAGVSDDQESQGRHHRRGSNFDLDNFNRIRRFGACEWCRKRKKRCSISHHV